jgi:hypothetical protein
MALPFRGALSRQRASLKSARNRLKIARSGISALRIVDASSASEGYPRV